MENILNEVRVSTPINEATLYKVISAFYAQTTNITEELNNIHRILRKHRQANIELDKEISTLYQLTINEYFEETDNRLSHIEEVLSFMKDSGINTFGDHDNLAA